MARLAILTAEFAPFRGGIGTYVREIAAAATRIGHLVTVFAPDYGKDLEAPDAHDFAFAVERFHAGAFGPRWYPRYARAVMKVLRGKRFGQILAADIPFIELLAITRLFHGTPYMAAIHGSEVKRSKHTLRGMAFAPARIFSSPDRIFANSRFTRKLLLETFPAVSAERVSVAYLGVSEAWFETAEQTYIPAILSPFRNRQLVVSVGRITPRKGQLTLIRALAGLPADIRARLALVLVGSAAKREQPYMNELHRAAEAAKPAEVVFAGSLENAEIRALYSIADVFCLPGSLQTEAVEGFGLVFLEAAAQGLAAVAGAVGGVSEVVRDGETGLLVPPDDPHTIGVVLADLLQDGERRKRLGAAALAHARTFTWERCARQTFGEA